MAHFVCDCRAMIFNFHGGIAVDVHANPEHETVFECPACHKQALRLVGVTLSDAMYIPFAAMGEDLGGGRGYCRCGSPFIHWSGTIRISAKPSTVWATPAQNITARRDIWCRVCEQIIFDIPYTHTIIFEGERYDGSQSVLRRYV